MSLVKVSTRIEGLEDDINNFTQELDKQIPHALQQVGSEMVYKLQEHIRTDWYEAWGAPKQYKRRTDYGGGISLGDEQNMDIQVKKNTLDFEYFPSGDHVRREWDERDGDTLIKVIQENKGWSFQPDLDKEGRALTPRPFWDNFVDEQEAVVVDNFIAAMPRTDIIKEPTDVLIDMSDSKVLSGVYSSDDGDNNASWDFDDDDLPY